MMGVPRPTVRAAHVPLTTGDPRPPAYPASSPAHGLIDRARVPSERRSNVPRWDVRLWGGGCAVSSVGVGSAVTLWSTQEVGRSMVTVKQAASEFLANR